ncbi:hypothetical protein AKJ57_03220 [candidate division MSBL1 archaeon SCGC-AAA259A05]|uniref:Type II secretion system protein GspF domain-containing protein n=1 Tax=candidate division MSBL1 archaeon SCGC-AAA259A05 TaxID=1698259 RepID=A0A133U9M3_9EURY|nr:hypothetical protein AKJ57_03220 [candidate division MSBL1 archaeon SCGC-AAA259A05]
MNFSTIYTKLCKIAGRSERLKNFLKPSPDLQKNLDFSELEVEGEEVTALAISGGIVGSVATGAVLLIAWLYDLSPIVPIITASLPILFFFSLGWYPSWRAKNKRTEELGNIPYLVSYMVSALKINPNLENATEFTAKRLKNPLGEDFRKELWKARLGIYGNVEEALSSLGRQWGEKSEELKRSIDLIKGSIAERNEKNRKNILDRALKTSFEGVRRRMESFISNLKLPTLIIYGVGILLPLVLLAVLPVISSTGFQISGLELAAIYCLFLPLGIYLLKKQVLAGRPAAFPPPDIPNRNNAGKAILTSIPAFLLPLFITIFLGFPQSLTALGFLWGLSSGIAIFCYLSASKSYRIREKNRRVEREFCDSLIQLGNQLKSNRPAEDAFRKTAEITKGGEVSKILEKTSSNLKVGGMDLRSALLDPEVGSLKGIYSAPVRNVFEMMMDFLNHSSRAAGEAILHSSRHLKELKRIEKEIRQTLGEIISSMKSVALFFAPLVASITIQLQQLLSKKTSGMPFFGNEVQIPGPTFLGVLGFYVIVITVLLSTYTVEIEWGNDELMKRMTIARALPTAMTVFTIGLFLGDRMLSVLIG